MHQWLLVEQALTDSRSEHPWVVQVALTALNQEDLEIVVEVGQSVMVRRYSNGPDERVRGEQTGQQQHIHNCHHRTQ